MEKVFPLAIAEKSAWEGGGWFKLGDEGGLVGKIDGYPGEMVGGMRPEI